MPLYDFLFTEILWKFYSPFATELNWTELCIWFFLHASHRESYLFGVLFFFTKQNINFPKTWTKKMHFIPLLSVLKLIF